MKYFSVFLLLITFTKSFANMASPIIPGDRGIKEVSSKNIDVVDEHIEIFIDSTFQSIKFKANYSLHSSKSGNKIPLLFIALGGYYPDRVDFIIHCDGKRITSQNIPYNWLYDSPSKFSNFNELWLYDNKMPNEALIEETDSICNVIGSYHIHDMNYFEVDLDTGFHNVSIEYIGKPTIDRDNWLNKYEIDYALSPIKYWKSYGRIKISIHSIIPLDELKFNYPTLIHNSNKGTCVIDSISRCNFSIKYLPKMNSSVSILLEFGQNNMTIVFGLIAFIFHCILIWGYRKIFNHKYSIILILGSILIPFLILYFKMYTYDIIDNKIGIHAGRFHGYTFFVMILYPIFLPIYWLLLWQIDKKIKRSIKKHIES